MRYAILCYDDEAEVASRTKEDDDGRLAERARITQRLAAQGRLGPVARLMPTSAAVTVRAGREPQVLDGPFAETREQLLGFYVIECDTLAEAIDAARGMGHDGGALEIRPLRTLEGGVLAHDVLQGSVYAGTHRG